MSFSWAGWPEMLGAVTAPRGRTGAMVIYPFSFEYMPSGVPANGRPRRQLAGSATARRSAAGAFHGSSAGLRVTETIGLLQGLGLRAGADLTREPEHR